MFAGSPSQCHASVLHWYLSYNASASWWGSFTCMLGLVNMRHKFWFVCNGLFAAVHWIYCWNTLLKQPDWSQGAHQGPRTAAREHSHAPSPLNTKIHSLLLCTWQKHRREVICEGGSQRVWRSKWCDLLWRKEEKSPRARDTNLFWLSPDRTSLFCWQTMKWTENIWVPWKNVGRKAWLWKRKVNWWGTISNPICNLGDHSHLCNF